MKKRKRSKPVRPTQGHWEKVGYMLFTTFSLVPRVECTGIFGRALGLRSDGQTYNSVAPLPFMVDKKYDWKKIASARLNTYLLSRCTCKTEGSCTMTCRMHRFLEKRWVAMNRRAVGSLPKEAPMADAKMGSTSNLQVMHKNYPWCCIDMATNEWVCDICGGRQNAYENNSSYRNQFIKRHSECGFPASGYAKAIQRCCLKSAGDVVREAQNRIKVLGDQAKVYRRVAEEFGSGRIHLPETMSFEQSVEWALDEGKIQAAPELKLLAKGGVE